jgi:hypothetical protein
LLANLDVIYALEAAFAAVRREDFLGLGHDSSTNGAVHIQARRWPDWGKPCRRIAAARTTALQR